MFDTGVHPSMMAVAVYMFINHSAFLMICLTPRHCVLSLLCRRFLIDDMMTRYGHVDAFLESSGAAALDRDTVRLSDDPTAAAAAADNNNTIKAKQKCAC